MAINLQRAARIFDPSKSVQTPDVVGPGTYANTHNKPYEPPGEAPVPFSSLEEKVLNPNGTTAAITPGPGAYTAKMNKPPSTHAHVSMASKVSRLGPNTPGSSVFRPSDIGDNPGPGTYPVPSSTIAAREDKKLVPTLKGVYEEAPEKTAPSIPVRKLPPGHKQAQYLQQADGDMEVLRMRHTGEPSDMVGPGEYDIAGKEIVMARGRDTAFYASKLNRKLWEPSVGIENTLPDRHNPGPGDYDYGLPLGGSTEEVAVATYQFASKSPMGHQVEVKEERVMPGPGRYESVGHIDKSVKAAMQRAEMMGEKAQFGSLSERTGWDRALEQPFTDSYNIHNVPGPGHYGNPQVTFMDEHRKRKDDIARVLPPSARKKMHGVHHPAIIMALAEVTGPLQAFNSTDDRPCNKALNQATPSPMDYHHEACRGQNMASALKERAKVGRKGVFGTCVADRFHGSPLNAKTGVPEPGGDGSVAAVENNSNKDPRYMFQSQSPRMGTEIGPRDPQVVKLGGFQTPAPGAYDISKEPNYRSPYRTPRQNHLAFGAGSTRYGSRDVFVEHTRGKANPGPGEYEAGVEVVHPRVTGAATVKSSRPKVKVGSTNETVGPGSYSSMETTMLKKTFNETMCSSKKNRSVAKGIVL
eukprot:TRINITY_DN19504_c0_g1_i1.p1 TRINITY_DN19504_c0_g1~~TRINITY_DN19504_c0_g1_i1.p1  ORF type:complete len:639 (-),score=110.70 TRINITY_DN19504_c0_g1_i1:64-1980(-)